MTALAQAHSAAKRPTSPEDRTILRALRIVEMRWQRPAEHFNSTDTAATFFRLRLAHLGHEVFEVAFLDTKNGLLSAETLSRGTIDSAEVHPREVAKRALELNAAALILAHNHPSGSNHPSRADLAVTAQIKAAVGLFNIRLLDHIIVSASGTTSLAAENRL